MPTGHLSLLPLLGFHLLGDSSAGRVEELAEFSVAVFQFLPFPAATSDLNMKTDTLSTSPMWHRDTPIPPDSQTQILTPQRGTGEQASFTPSSKFAPKEVENYL